LQGLDLKCFVSLCLILLPIKTSNCFEKDSKMYLRSIRAIQQVAQSIKNNHQYQQRLFTFFKAISFSHPLQNNFKTIFHLQIEKAHNPTSSNKFSPQFARSEAKFPAKQLSFQLKSFPFFD
jgi:hypothetical protein